MCNRSTRSYRRILFLSVVIMTLSASYFIFTVHAKWQNLMEATQYWRGSAKQSRNHLFQQVSPVDKKKNEVIPDTNNIINEKGKLITINNSSSDANKSSTPVFDSIDNSKETKCPNGSVYFSNKLYDCDGIMKDARFKEINKSKLLEQEAEDSTVAPVRVKQDIPTQSSKVKNKSFENRSSDNNQRTAKKEPRKIFVNCGGTFPETVELFMDTYPKSSSYSVFTFLREKSYTVMYSLLPNHTVVPFEASYKNSSKNVDVKSFGADAETTQALHQIDLSGWLGANTKKEDFVVLRIDSEDEGKIFEHLIKNKTIEHIDKYYTTRAINASKQEMISVEKSLRKIKLKFLKWDNDMKTYSDFFLLNPNHIPVPGKHITMCQQTKDSEKFALFLYSPSASVNSIKVIDLLHSFSPEDRLPLTIFLGYEVFKCRNFVNMEKLFRTFNVGMYYDGENSLHANDKLLYNQLRNKLLFVRRLFSKFDKTFQYVMTGNNTREKIISRVRKDLHYSFIQGGKDVTNLTEKSLAGKTISIDDTGKSNGDYLLVNIDTLNTEYLVLYMVRRFAPWLLSITECDFTSSGSLLNRTDAFVS